MALAEADALVPEWRLLAGVCSVSSGVVQAWRKDLVQHSLYVIPLQQNISSAFLSLLTSSPTAKNAKANLLSFVLFSACYKERGGRAVLCSLGPTVYGLSIEICYIFIIINIVTVHSSLTVCAWHC